MEENKNFLLEDRLAKKLLRIAERIANFLIPEQILDPKDLRYGLFTGGLATYQLKLSSDSKIVTGAYTNKLGKWVSSEHNIDAFFFLRDLARITINSKYENSSILIRTGLLSIWEPTVGQVFRGIKETQKIDRYLPLDAASWGAFFLISIGEHQKALSSLTATQLGILTIYGVSI
jgi:hypothetical protein